MKQGTLNFKKKVPESNSNSNISSQVTQDVNNGKESKDVLMKNCSDAPTAITNNTNDNLDVNMNASNGKRKMIIDDEEENLAEALLIPNTAVKLENTSK